MKLGPLVSSVLLMWLSAASAVAKSDCIVVEFDAEQAFRNSDLLFSGVVTDVDTIGDRIRFRVDRIWKGDVRRDTWIYLLGSPGIDSHVFRPQSDVKYIIAARRLSEDERQYRVKAGDPPVFGIEIACGSGPRWSPDDVRKLERIRKSRKPSD